MEDLFCLGIKVLIQNPQSQILLLKVSNKLIQALPEFKGNTIWDLPGGRASKGEQPHDTLRREVKEETGITELINLTPFSMTLSPLRVMSGNINCGLILKIYTCSIPIGTHIQLSNENSQFDWFNPPQAAHLLQTKYPADFTNKVLLLTQD